MQNKKKNKKKNWIFKVLWKCISILSPHLPSLPPTTTVASHFFGLHCIVECSFVRLPLRSPLSLSLPPLSASAVAGRTVTRDATVLCVTVRDCAWTWLWHCGQASDWARLNAAFVCASIFIWRQQQRRQRQTQPGSGARAVSRIK